MTTAFLDSTSAALVKGDVVCLIADAAGMQVVTKATPAATAVAGRAWGIAEGAVLPGKSGRFKRDGMAPPTLTGLSAAGFVRVSSAARAEVVGSYTTGDIPLGKSDERGNLNLALEMGAGIVPGVAGLGGSETVAVTGVGTLVVSIPEDFIGLALRTTGADQRAGIQALLTTAAAAYASTGVEQTVRLGRGVWRIGAALDLPTGVRLVGAGSRQTAIAPHASWTPSVGLADDPTNCLIRIVGAVSTTLLNTTQASPARGLVPGVRQIILNSAGSLTALRWMLAEGHNDIATDHGLTQDGNGVVLSEMLQVADSYVSGTTVPLAFPASVHHTLTNGGTGTAQTVRGVVPIEHAAIEGIDLRGDGRTFAVGILVVYAHDVVLRDVSGAGFSRAIVDARGSRAIEIDGLHNRGECNAILMLDSCQNVRARRITCALGGKRSHANGVVRWGINTKNRCTDVWIDADIRHMCGGANNVGGVNCRFELRCDDLDATRLVATQPATMVRGVAWQGGRRQDSGNYGELALSTHLNIQASNIRQTTDDFECAVDLYKYNGFSSDHIEVNNDGAGPAVVLEPGFTGRANGIRIEYVKGHVDRVQTRGVNWGWRHVGNPGHGDVRVTSAWFYGAFDGGSGAIAVDFSYSTIDSGTVFGELRTDNMAVTVLFGGVPGDDSWTANPDWRLFIDRLELDHKVYMDVVPALNKSGTTIAQGDIVEIDNVNSTTGQNWVKQASGPNPRNAVVAYGGANNGYVLIATSFRRAEVQVASAVKAGDLLEVNASRQAVPQATPSFNCFAKALTSANAGFVIVGAK